MPLRVCVNEIDEITFSGCIYNLVQDPIQFQNYQEFIVETDKFLDACGHPQSSIDKRSMKENKEITNRYQFDGKKVRSMDSLKEYSGSKDTFDLYIHTRSRGDWQGEIIRGDKPSEPFSNILELMIKIIR